jgi:hypothetical protein
MYNARQLGRLPLFGGEGTDRGIFQRYIDLKVML